MTVGVIGDTHIPFEMPGYLSFVKRVFKRWNVDRVVHIGDVVDNHALSYHESDPDGYSAGDEATRVDQKLELWYKAFPDIDVLLGNHDKLPERKAKTYGLSQRLIKSFVEIWHTPPKWRVHPGQIEIDGVIYTHGTGSSGKNAALNLAIAKMQSVVVGHSHSFAGVQTIRGREHIFGMNVGCGIDEDAYAFEYGQYHKYRPTLGCGIVVDGKRAYFEPWED